MATQAMATVLSRFVIFQPHSSTRIHTLQPRAVESKQPLFSLVGLLLGALQALVLVATAQLLPFSIAVLVTLLAGLVLTGAFHEDGLADTADGLGGGLSVERKLEIMKDSRVGTYGLVALLSVFLIKWQSLLALDTEAIWALVLVARIVTSYCTQPDFCFALSAVGFVQ